jgi:hypothetical protein
MKNETQNGVKTTPTLKRRGKIYANFVDKIMCPVKKRSVNISKCVKCDHCNEIGQNRRTLGYFVNCDEEI